MTRSELVEAMAREIKRQLQRYADFAGLDFVVNDLEMAARAALAVARPQIEAALLESMETLSGDGWIVGRATFEKYAFAYEQAQTSKDKMIQADVAPAEIWRSMLAAFRKERGL